MAGVSVLKDVCAVGATTHALLDARSMLAPANLLAAPADEAARFLGAAANDLTVAADAAATTSLGATAIHGVRSALAGAQRAPSSCRDHALDVVRGHLELTLTEHAAAHAASTGATGPLASTRGALLRAISVLGGGAALGARGAQLSLGAAARHDAVTVDQVVAAAARCFHETPVANRAPYHVGSDATATASLLAVEGGPDARLALSRTGGHGARDALAEVFVPIVHDLATHARAMRDAPLERIPLAGKAVKETAPRRAVELLRTFMPLDDGILGRASRFERMLASQMMPIDIATQLDIPVGEHGAPLAHALVKAGRALDAIVFDRLGGQLERIGAENEELLTNWAFQRAQVHRSMVEGVTSIGHSLAVLTSRRIEGVDEFQMLDAIDRGFAIDRIAKGPSGFIAPIVRHGLDVATPLEVGANGVAKLGPDLDRLLRSTTAFRRSAVIPGKTTQAGCPVSLRLEVQLVDGRVVPADRTLLAQLSTEYVDLTKRYLRRELDGS